MEIVYPDSNRLGQFFVPYEVLRNGADRPLLQALFGLCLPLKTEEHENGRGLRYYAVSAMFQELLEGEEIPEYRIAMVCGKFENPEYERQRTNSGEFGFVAVRNTIIRVPPVHVSVNTAPLNQVTH